MNSGYSKKPMSEIVYEKLREEILNNELKPGEKLIEMDISKRLDVSRTPVREALKQLEQEGLVTNYPRKGSTVSQISIEEAIEVYEVREYLEALAIRQLCLNIRRKDIRVLEEIINNMDISVSKNDNEKLYSLHSQWTKTIIELITNNYLKNQMISIYQHLERLRSVSLVRWEHSKEAFEETKQIFLALEEGDEDKSEECARVHVRNAKKRFISNVRDTTDVIF